MRTKLRRPSPALIVAVIALIAGLTGSAIGLPGKNSVDKNDLKKNVVSTKTIKKNAVTRAKLRNNAVNSSKVAANSINGTDIKESSLGQVPSAASVPFIRQINARLSFGQDVELVSNGNVSLRARCVQNGTIQGAAARDGVQVYARSAVPGSFLAGSDNRGGDSNGDGLLDAESLDPADAPDDSDFASIAFNTAAPDEQFVTNTIDNGFVISPTGSYIGVNAEDFALGVRALGANCAVIGQAFLQG